MNKFLVFAFVALLPACATTPTGSTSNPQASVFQIKQSYELALQVAVAYDNLPPCVTGVKAICSEHSVKLKLKQAKDVASPAIQAAENAVRDPTFNASASSAVITAANQAVIALTAITAALAVSH